jgi:CRISPR-associated exonuclease Cas4
MDIRLIPLSALQHYTFCPRQCAIIHNEQQWKDNYLTTVGNLFHERVDSGIPETRMGIRYERGVRVSSARYNLTGKLDLLEFDRKSKLYTPVEYKKGRPKRDKSDLVQLCAQALCIEEMCNTTVECGAFWYWGIRRRINIPINSELRDFTVNTIDKVRELFDSGKTPRQNYSKMCDACSLYDLCEPKLQADGSAQYVKSILSGDI